MSTRRLAGLLVAPLASLLPLGAAASPIVLDDRTDAHSVLEHLDVLVDRRGELSPEEAVRRDFEPPHEVDAGLGSWPGQRPPIVWMRFAVRIPAGGTRGDWALVIGRPHGGGTVYVEQGRGGFRKLALTLDPGGGSARVALPREPGTRTVLLRIPGPITRPSLLHVATARGEERLTQRLLTAQGLYLGVMLAMLLVNLLVGLLLRDRTQLWYVGFIAASAAAFSLLMGTVSRFLLPAVPATALFRPQNAFLAALVLTGIQFGRLFLDTPRTAPRWDRVMRVYVLLAAAVLVAALVGPDELALRALAVLGVLVPFVTIGAGVAARRAGSRWARFYLVGWSLFAVGGFLFAAPIGQDVVDGLAAFQASSALEAALFSVALVDRMRILQRERTQAEQKVVRAEKLASLGQLVAGVAHEVNNPNNFLTFNLPIVQEYLDALRPHVEEAARRDPGLRLYGMTADEFFADAAKLVGNMQHGTERIAAIVSQLRSYVRQNDETQWEEADVNRVVENATTLVRTQLVKHVDRVESHLGEGLPRVRMIPGRIEQVVINLLLNAAQAAGKVAGGKVEVRTARENGHVTIAVLDDGPGVPPELRERIFEPFFTTKSGEQGTGMGLAISQRIVEEHGGTLELRSDGRRGACFVVRLPLSPVEPT